MSSTAEQTPRTPARLFATLAKGASGVVLILVVAAVAATMLVPPLLGYDLYAIDGGSMEPAIHRGAIAYSTEVPVTELKVRDVITYVPPGHSRAVTHRIIGIDRPDPRAKPVYRTKGDANARPDLRIFRLDRPTQARFAFSVPLIGWVMIFLAIPLVKIVALGLPALLIGLWIMGSLWKEGGRNLRERDEAAEEYGALDAEDEAFAAGVGAGAR